MSKLIIQGTLPNLNDYTKANRANRYAGANLKKKTEDMIAWHIMQQLHGVHYDNPVTLRFHWFEANRRRDLDNIAFAKKFILDALVKNEIIDDDNWGHVRGFVDVFRIDKENPRVEVVIGEVQP